MRVSGAGCSPVWHLLAARAIRPRANIEYRATGNWVVEKQTDRGAPISSSALAAKSSRQHEVFPKSALLQLMCFKEGPVALCIRGQGRLRAQFRIWLPLRRKTGRQINPRFVDDYRSALIDRPDELRAFIADLQTSQTLDMLIRSLNVGRTSVEFKLDGAQAAVAAAYASCPIPPPNPRGRQAKPALSHITCISDRGRATRSKYPAGRG